MSANQRLWMVSFLVSLYPAQWREEYGDELQDVLLARPISVATVNDVVWSAIGQRVRYLPPHAILGLPSMAFFAAWCSINVMWPETMLNDWSALIHHTTKVQPPAVVYSFDTVPFVLLLVVCGAWTHQRLKYSAPRCGVAAMQLTGYAGFPVMVLGTLMAFDVVSLSGFTALQVFATTYFQFGTSFVWGALSGFAARWYLRRKVAAA